MAKKPQESAKAAPASSFDAASAFVQDESKLTKPFKTNPLSRMEFGDRVIRLTLVPTRGGDGTVVKLIKYFPRAPWSEGVQEDWGLVIDAGEAERPIAAICVNLLAQRQEINLSPLDVPDMAEAIKKYTDLGWIVE